MQKIMIKISVLLLVVLSFSCLTMSGLEAAPKENIAADERCPVCGMFVAKYDVWITQIRIDQSTIHCFDGVKDMMAFYLNPKAYNGPEQSEMSEIWVKDYYSLKWVDGRKAFFVIGSDVNGPMGHELIPFSTRAAAEAFLADHHGQGIFSFDQITAETVEKLRAGSRMKGMDK